MSGSAGGARDGELTAGARAPGAARDARSPRAGAGWLDRLLPRALLEGSSPRATDEFAALSGDRLRRARLAAAIAVAVSSSQLLGLVYSLLAGLLLPAAGMALALALLSLSLVALRRTGRVALCGNLVAGTLFFIVGMICASDRGVETPLIVADAAVILVAILVAGRRAGYLWGVASVLEIWALYGAGALGYEFPHMLDRPGEVLNMAFVVTVLIGVVTAIGILYETLHQRAVAGLAEQAARLDHARRASERASQAKTRFLGDISHELRTPMNGIMGLTRLLLSDELTPRQRELLEMQRRTERTLLALLNDVLDLRRIEAGHVELEVGPVDLRALVSEVGSLLEPRATAQGLALTSAVAVDVPRWLSLDGARVRQVLINLVGNALKFTDAGTVAVAVTCPGAQARGDARVRLSVADSGRGIPADRLDTIFDPFARGSATRGTEGTGLGLAITRELVIRMGGEIEVSSELGRGTTFHVTLPRVACEAPATPAAREPDAALSASARGVYRGRVLLVEDNRVNQVVAQGMLRKLGCVVELASSGPEALARVTGGDAPYDVILMDYQMPGMDGLETTRRVRAREQGARVPIVALTARVMAGDRRACLEAGMDDFLSKPLELRRLDEVLSRYLMAAE